MPREREREHLSKLPVARHATAPMPPCPGPGCPRKTHPRSVQPAHVEQSNPQRGRGSMKFSGKTLSENFAVIDMPPGRRPAPGQLRVPLPSLFAIMSYVAASDGRAVPAWRFRRVGETERVRGFRPVRSCRTSHGGRRGRRAGSARRSRRGRRIRSAAVASSGGASGSCPS